MAEPPPYDSKRLAEALRGTEEFVAALQFCAHYNIDVEDALRGVQNARFVEGRTKPTAGPLKALQSRLLKQSLYKGL